MGWKKTQDRERPYVEWQMKLELFDIKTTDPRDHNFCSSVI